MKKIYCAGCNKYLGEIRDATLRKNIVNLCSNCETKRKASDLANQTAPKSPFDSFMDSLWRGK